MMNITPCPFCGRLHSLVMLYECGQVSWCCPDKIHKPFERKDKDEMLPLHRNTDTTHRAPGTVALSVGLQQTDS